MVRRRERRWERLSACSTRGGIALCLGFIVAAPSVAEAQTCTLADGSTSPSSCYSNNPNDWPAPARPYYMVVFDTSGSMIQCTNPPTSFPTQCPGGATVNSCGWPPSRINDGKCAMRQMLQAFSEVDFGLTTFRQTISGCGSSPYSCTPYSVDGYMPEYANNCSINYQCGGTGSGAWGGTVRVGLPITTSTLTNALSWTDNDCGSGTEVMPAGATPINGSLRDAAAHLRANSASLQPFCRPVSVILITDGGESCDGTEADNRAQFAAQDLYVNGLNDGSGRHVTVYPIGFGGITGAETTALNNIAKMGQCGTTSGSCANGVSALTASNEVQLSQALASIIAGAVRPEECNNVDDNCNGCVDEGYSHFCNSNPTCCSWANTTQRNTCLSNYQASITTANPTGDLTLLPCTTSGQANNCSTWLCYNPGDVCDEQDNNCNSTTDEGALKCGGHCPTTEVCNGEDDDCNGIIDEAAGNPNPYSIPGCSACVPSAELCDGCDNDCDGIADNDVAPLTCGIPTPPNCAGTISCGVPQAVSSSGACLPGAPTSRWGTCSNSPATEVCDGVDNNCNGQIDEGIPPTACEIPGQPGLVYNDTNPLSVCQRGQQPCNGQCSGWIGPSQEICDGKDNDCDGLVDGADSDLVGVGQVCDGVCDKGTTACVNGVLVCQSSVQPQPEVCDGVDNDCNGIVDDGNLLDEPSPANEPCWDIDPTACATPCSYAGATNTVLWCAPDNAGCHDIGTLATPPCQLGSISCLGGAWVCSGGLPPEQEVCDAVDNDCNGSIDDGLATTTCGTNEGECQAGTQVCVNGALVCQNAIGPVPEVCNGLDDDCDGEIDNGIAIGTPCSPEYDTSEYPGARDKGQCKPGVSECGPSGEVICTGGVGPAPEVCDGLDNDCDGQVDEVGAPPDGVNGTSNPQDPSQVIGEECGSAVGACEPGIWACVNADFVCVGGVAPQTEVCDCSDNDCDGETDEDPVPGSGDPALCSEDKACVVYQNGCQCAGLCGGGEYPCPTGGFVCEAVNYSSTGESAGNRCVIDGCGDCSTKTEIGPGGVVECAPEGTVLDSGVKPPVCVCIQNDCHKPCVGVSCTPPQVCTDYGPNAGKCVEDNCWNVPCPASQACNFGTCTDSPCQAGVCEADQVCKPSEDFTSYECVGSCAGVTCEPTEDCVGGTCVPTGCAEPCETDQVCVEGACVQSQCDDNTCPNGSYCDPVTGQCGNYPCAGVTCPSGQECEDGECVEGSGGSGGTGGTGGSGGSSGTAGTGGGTTDGGTQDGSAGSGGGTDPDEDEKGNWGLATGGGGCACETGVGAPKSALAAAIGLLIGVAFMRRRTRTR